MKLPEEVLIDVISSLPNVSSIKSFCVTNKFNMYVCKKYMPFFIKNLIEKQFIKLQPLIIKYSDRELSEFYSYIAFNNPDRLPVKDEQLLIDSIQTLNLLNKTDITNNIPDKLLERFETLNNDGYIEFTKQEILDQIHQRIDIPLKYNQNKSINHIIYHIGFLTRRFQFLNEFY